MKANFQNGDIIQKKGVKSMDAIFNRTSIRKYKQESLKKEEIDLILKAAFSALVLKIVSLGSLLLLRIKIH